jgi:hypothetical protein
MSDDVVLFGYRLGVFDYEAEVGARRLPGELLRDC